MIVNILENWKAEIETELLISFVFNMDLLRYEYECDRVMMVLWVVS